LNENFIENKQLDLDGFSGNKIEVIRSKGNTFVRKTAKNIKENEKMEKEIKKLEMLQKISQKYNDFKVPKILLSNKNEKQLLFYELEFISGENFDSSLEKLNSEKIKIFSKKIGRIIETFSHESINNKINEKEFLKQKFGEMIDTVNKIKLSTNLGKELFKECKQNIYELEINKNDLNNKSTFCHGDFALDNVLITKKYEIYLIDPLHNDYENIMWDYAKILQSSMAYWNLIKYQNFQLISNNKKIRITPNEHVTMFHRHFLKNLESENISTITVYLAATLARVTKYAKTEKQLCALLIIINELLTDYSNGKCDLSETLNSLRW
jgi:tRNA A-37 threonylcarbamoyl transferase component Bud32